MKFSIRGLGGIRRRHVVLQKHEETNHDDDDRDSSIRSSSSSSDNEFEQQQQHHASDVPRVVITDSFQNENHKEMERIAKAAAALDNYGNALFEQGQYQNAMASYSKALHLKKRTLDSIDNDDQQHDNDSQQQYMLASMATSMNNIGYLRQRSGARADETMAAYTDSLRIKQQILGRDSLSVAKTLNNIGSVHFLTRNLAQAMAAYKEAHEIMEHNLGRHHLDVATVCSNIGDVHLAMKDADTAGRMYREALNIRWEQLGDGDPKVIRLLEKIALIEMGELEEAQQLGWASEKENDEEEEADKQGIPKELDTLLDEVKEDMKHVDNVNRQFAIDMVKEKLQMRKEMRAMEEGVEIANDKDNEEESSPTRSPLSPCDRVHALSAVKERLAKIRSDRDLGIDSMSPTPAPQRKLSSLRRRSPDLNSSTSTEDTLHTETTGGESNRDRAQKRHWQAAENVKERLERLRVTNKMGASTSKFERDGFNALRRIELDDSREPTQQAMKSTS